MTRQKGVMTDKPGIQSWIAILIAGGLLLFAILEVNFNLFNTDLGKNGAQASKWWILGELFAWFISGFILYKSNRTADGISVGAVVMAGIFVAVGICARCGFFFPFA